MVSDTVRAFGGRVLAVAIDVGGAVWSWLKLVCMGAGAMLLVAALIHQVVPGTYLSLVRFSELAASDPGQVSIVAVVPVIIRVVVMLLLHYAVLAIGLMAVVLVIDEYLWPWLEEVGSGVVERYKKDDR